MNQGADSFVRSESLSRASGTMYVCPYGSTVPTTRQAVHHNQTGQHIAQILCVLDLLIMIDVQNTDPLTGLSHFETVESQVECPLPYGTCSDTYQLLRYNCSVVMTPCTDYSCDRSFVMRRPEEQETHCSDDCNKHDSLRRPDPEFCQTSKLNKHRKCMPKVLIQSLAACLVLGMDQADNRGGLASEV